MIAIKSTGSVQRPSNNMKAIGLTFVAGLSCAIALIVLYNARAHFLTIVLSAILLF